MQRRVRRRFSHLELLAGRSPKVREHPAEVIATATTIYDGELPWLLREMAIRRLKKKCAQFSDEVREQIDQINAHSGVVAISRGLDS